MTDPIIAKLEARKRQQQAAVVLQAQDNTPDQSAAQQNLAKRAGVPLGIVRSDADSVRRQVERDELASLSATSPALARWAEKPEHYAVARDDLGPLDALSRIVQKPLDWVHSASAGFGRTVGSTLAGAGELFDVVGRRGARGIETLLGLEANQQPLEQRLGWSPVDALRIPGQAIKRLADRIDVPEEARGLDTDIAGGIGQLGSQVVQSLVAAPTVMPSLLAQGADQMAERVGGAGMEGTTGGDLAILGGAGITGLTEKYGLDKLLNRVPPKVRNAVMRRIADMAAGGGIEAAQEVTEGIAQDVLHKALLDDDHEIGGGILRQAEAAGGSGAIARLVVQIAGGRRAHAQAQAERADLDAAVHAAAGSKTRTRAPEQFEAAVEAMAPERRVYAPVDALVEHFRTAPDAVAAINVLAGDPNAYAEAMATGADVAIPLSRYLSTIGTDAHAALAGRLRISPAEEVRPDTILPDRAQVEQQIAADLAEARTYPDTVERIRSEYRPLLTDPQQADDWQGYQEAVQRAKSATIAERVAEQERIAAIARDKRLRKDTTAIVETELRSHPVYRAERLLRSGKGPDGNSVIKPIKLDHAAVVAAVGEDAAAKLKGMTRKQNGVTPDEAAALLGYPSGAKLLHDMTTAPAFADMVRIETDARMGEHAKPQERHADDAQAEVLLREVQAIESRNGGIRTHDASLREIARRLIADKSARDLQPHVYRMAESKAAREAFQAAAKGDMRAAGQARRRQLQNLYLYREARKAAEEVASAGKRFSQLSKRSSLAKIGKAGSDYQEQLRALLGRFDFRALTGPQIDARTSLAKWIKAKAAEGVTIDLPPSITDEAFRTPFRRMKIGEIRDLRQAVEQIIHAANEANTLRANGERFDRMLTDEAMALSVRAGGTVRPTRTGDRTKWDKAREELWHARAMTGGATDLARELDGFKDGGAVWAHTVGVIRDADDRTQAELDKAAEALAGIKLRHYSKAELRGMSAPKHFPGIGDWSKGRVLALALNWGNAGNREAILTQVDNRVSSQQVGELLGSLDARDWDFVQDVWKLIDGYWPAIAESQRRRRGIVPEKVEATPFGVITRDGKELSIPGGYFPLKYGGNDANSLAEEASTMYEDVRTGRFAKAATRDGHTIERVGSGGKEVRLDLGVIDGHLRNVVRDLHLGDAVNMVHTTLHGAQFTRAVNDTGKAQVIHGLDLWLRDVATGEIGLRHFHEKALRLLRVNGTAAVLTWRPSSAALQVTGVFQSAVALGSPRAMLDGVARFLRRPVTMTRYATEASPKLARRLRTHVEAVEMVMNAEAGRFSEARAEMIRRGYWMMGRVQATVDVATWIAAEKQGLAKFNGDIRKARQYADDLVTRAQGSNDWIDKNAIQRGTLGDNVRQAEWVRATTTLMGYLIAKQNVGIEAVRKTNLKDIRSVSKLAGNLFVLYALEGIVAKLVRGDLPDDEEKDGSRFDDMVRAAGFDTLGTVFGAVPGIGQLATELRGYTDRSVLGDLWHAVAEAKTQAGQGEADKGAVKAAVKLGGLATGLPSSQINKDIDALAKAQDGHEVTPWEYLNGPNGR